MERERLAREAKTVAVQGYVLIGVDVVGLWDVRCVGTPNSSNPGRKAGEAAYAAYEKAEKEKRMRNSSPLRINIGSAETGNAPL